MAAHDSQSRQLDEEDINRPQTPCARARLSFIHSQPNAAAATDPTTRLVDSRN